MFAFHQYFHSSFRARQGKVLERVLQEILRKYGNCDSVPIKNKERLSIVEQIFDITEFPNLDIDLLASDYKNDKTLMIQLRSRDDTGGTTAKGSLVELLQELLRLNKVPQSNILYLVCIWDARDTQQKVSTVRKMYSTLKDFTQVNEADFHYDINNKVELNKNISLKIAYGTDEIAASLYEWIGNENEVVLDAISAIVDMISKWDDLWIAYAIANIELEVKTFCDKSNIALLNEKFEKIGNDFSYLSYQSLTDAIDEIVRRIIPLWKEDSIPMKTLSDKAQYIRDLLFLKAHYEKK